MLRRGSCVRFFRRRHPLRRDSLVSHVRIARGVVVDSALWALWQLRSLLPLTVPKHWRAGDDTVVLIPGLATNWRFMWQLGDVLAHAGFRVEVLPQLGRMTADVSDLATEVTRALRASGRERPVVLVTHSKGGLVAKRVLLRDPECELVAGAITLSAPFQGAVAAKLVRGEFRSLRNVVMLRPGTPSTLELAGRSEANSRIVTVSPLIDEIVGKRGPLPGARNIAVSVIGHNRLLALSRVQQLVVREARRLMRQGRSADTNAPEASGR